MANLNVSPDIDDYPYISERTFENHDALDDYMESYHYLPFVGTLDGGTTGIDGYYDIRDEGIAFRVRLFDSIAYSDDDADGLFVERKDEVEARDVSQTSD